MAVFRKKKKDDEGEKRPLNKQGLKKLLGIYQFVLPYKGVFSLGMVSLFFSSTVLLAFPYFTGKMVDVAIKGPEGIYSSLHVVALILLGILLVQSVFSFLRIYLFAQVNERAMADLRTGLYKQFVSLPLTYFDKNRTGEMVSRMTSDVALLQDTFSITLAEFFRQIVTLLVGIVAAVVLTPKIALFVIALFPILVVFAIIFGKRIRKLSKATQDELAVSNVVIEETLQAVDMVKAFANEHFEFMRFRKSQDKVVKIALKASTARGAFVSFIISTMFGAIVGVLWFGAYQVSQGDLTVGELTTFLLYTVFIGGSMAGLGDIMGTIQKAIGASERVLEILGEDTEEVWKPCEKLTFKGEIEFQDISFAYPTRNDVTVLKNLSFKVNSGEKVALVGHSGTGKSTTIQLLLRFYEGFDGKVKVDGKDSLEYSLHVFRDNFSIVPQEVLLFGGSIRENIAYGKPSASNEEIEAAARKAFAIEFINNFPEGMETLVGERGVKLSGGQRQRIAIARAILKDPAILILDEATSSLDAESESKVQAALNELMKNRTTIIIAHRLSTIREVDRILVLDKGELVEEGTHQKLLEKEAGIYANLVRLQFEENS